MLYAVNWQLQRLGLMIGLPLGLLKNNASLGWYPLLPLHPTTAKSAAIGVQSSPLDLHLIWKEEI